jgi:hypothetical protein
MLGNVFAERDGGFSPEAEDGEDAKDSGDAAGGSRRRGFGGGSDIPERGLSAFERKVLLAMDFLVPCVRPISYIRFATPLGATCETTKRATP